MLYGPSPFSPVFGLVRIDFCTFARRRGRARGRRLKEAVSAGNAPGENTKRTQFRAGSSRRSSKGRKQNGKRRSVGTFLIFSPKREHTGRRPAPPSVESSLRVAPPAERTKQIDFPSKTEIKRPHENVTDVGRTRYTARGDRVSVSFSISGFFTCFPNIIVCPAPCTRIRTFWKAEHFSYSWKKFVFCLRPPLHSPL